MAPGRTAVPGALIYQRVTGGRLSVVTIRDGATTTRDCGPVTDAEHVRTVSPDGTRVALIHSPDPGQVKPGDLVVVTEGGARHTVASDVSWGSGEAATWTPDGTRVMVEKDGG